MMNSILNEKKILPIKAGDICNLLEGSSLHGVDPDSVFSSVAVSDNMEITTGCLFIPYQETDDFMRSAVKTGAAAVMTDHAICDIPYILVNDLTQAVYCLCELFYKAINLPSIVICGSTGKTTTKRFIKSVLKQNISVFSQDGNYNTLQALCCSLQQVSVGTSIIVQEIDEKRIHNTLNCSRILKPSIVVVTNIGDSHIGFYGGKEGLIHSFLGIEEGLSEESITILNGDDEDSMKAGFKGNIQTVGINNQHANCYAFNIVNKQSGMVFTLCYEGKKHRVKLSAQGEHNAYNAMMAFLIGKQLGINDKDILKGLKSYKDSGFRQNSVCYGNVLVYADCYNASAKSIEYAIKCFCDITKRRGKKVAVIGDIAEIEGYEEEIYRRIANAIDASQIDQLITYGKESRRIINYLTSENIEREHAEDLLSLNSLLENQKRRGRKNYLFKASRSMHLETSVQEVFPEHYKIMIQQEKQYRS